MILTYFSLFFLASCAFTVIVGLLDYYVNKAEREAVERHCDRLRDEYLESRKNGKPSEEIDYYGMTERQLYYKIRNK